MQEYTVRVGYDRTEWFQNGLRHRIDGPAIEYKNGNKSWYQNGDFHRTDGPAIEYANGDKSWFQNGQRHRIDGPAIEWKDGTVEYWEDGRLIPNPNNTKEMTVKEISDKLGFNVKIVK